MNHTTSQFAPFAQIHRDVFAKPLKDGNEVAEYIGNMEGFGDMPALALYNLTRSVGAYPNGSTVTAETLRALGYSAPTAPDIYDSRSFDDAGEILCN